MVAYLQPGDPAAPADVAAALVGEVEAYAARWRDAPAEAAARRPAPGVWSPAEVVGHLLDSAANNLQRFVRAEAGAANAFPGYDQDAWVDRQAPAEAPWRELVELWRLTNRHVARAVARMPPDVEAATCTVGDGPPVTVGVVAADYLAHLRHHVRQVDDRLATALVTG